MGPGRSPRQSRAVEGVIWLPEKWPSIAKRRLYFGVGSRRYRAPSIMRAVPDLPRVERTDRPRQIRLSISETRANRS
jgi:hypothetical protein